MPPHIVLGPGSSATRRHPPPLPPAWSCLQQSIVRVSRLGPGKEARVPSYDFWFIAGTGFWLRRQRHHAVKTSERRSLTLDTAATISAETVMQGDQDELGNRPQ